MKNDTMVVKEVDASKEHWFNILEKEIEYTDLSICNNELLQYEKGNYEFELSEEVFGKLLAVTKGQDLSSYVFILAAFKILLYKYNSIEDTVVLSPVLSKCDEYFNQYVLFRDNVNNKNTFKEFLLDVKNTVSSAYKNQKYPVIKLASSLGIEREKLFNNPILCMKNIHNKNILDEIENIQSGINIVINKSSEKIECNVNYNSKKIDLENMKKFIESFKYILMQVLNDINIRILDIELINEEERKRIIQNYSSGNESTLTDKTINELFEEQVKKTPEKVAIKCKKDQLTYNELNKKANQLARELIKNGISKGDIVGIKMERSCELIISVIAVLKAGAAYLPIDLEYPEDRVKYMIERSNCKVVLTNYDNNIFNGFLGKIISLHNNVIYENEHSNFENINEGKDILNIIFTSGSTGIPKGVLIKHESMVNYALWRIKNYKLTSDDKALQLISFSFDGFGSNFYSTILSGGVLIIPSEEKIYDYQYIKDLIVRESVTNISVVPSMYKSILLNSNSGDLGSLNVVVLAAERADKNLINESKNINPNLIIVNEYGPTENTITTTALIGMDEDTISTVGRPIDNHRVYIINKDENVLPIGVEGEICASGIGLADSYLDDHNLTEKKFTIGKFNGGERLYHTGDMGRWLPNGHIQLSGRIDNQVKIRGFRIEIDEIEKRLNEDKKIENAVVVSRNDTNGNKILVAYIVSKDKLEPKEIREGLLNKIPKYMIPSYFINIESIPKMKNGKVDRVALSNKEIINEKKDNVIGPRNKLEEKIAKVWSEILCLDSFGINDDFFMLGGDSIKAIQIVARLREFGIKLSVRNLLENPTISEVLKYVEYDENENIDEIVTGKVEITPIQRWFFNQKFEEKNHFNQSMLLYKKCGFNESYIKVVFDRLMEIHDALRMSFEIRDGQIYQFDRKIQEGLYEFEIIDLKNNQDYENDMQTAIKRLQKSMDLQKNIVKVGLFKTPHGDQLFISIHHLVVDGVSLRILMEDFIRLYNDLEKNKPYREIKKTNSYKEWSLKLVKYANSTEFLNKSKYWTDNELQEVEPLKNYVEVDENLIKNEVYEEICIDKENTAKLLKKSNRAYNTEINDVLLTALGMAISDWGRIDKVLIDLEGHGREDIISNIDITRTVGWFTSIYPVILDIRKKSDIGVLIKQVKETLRRIPNKGIGYGILKYLVNEENMKLESKLKPQIGFNYLGQVEESEENSEIKISNSKIVSNISETFNKQHLVDINGMIINGELRLRFSYNQNMYSRNSILELEERYKENLINIINWCSERESIELTPSDVDNIDLTFEELDYIQNQYEDNIEKIYNLTSMQEGMLYHSITNKDRDPYFQEIEFDINGRMDINILEKALNNIIQNNEIFRINFIYDNVEKPRQVLQKNKNIKVNFVDIRNMDDESKKIYVQKYIDKNRNTRFDLSKDILIRMSIIQIEDEVFKVLWDFHHIIIDGWSVSIFIRELLSKYKQFTDNNFISRVIKPYGSFIKWLNKKDTENDLNFWEEYLDGYNNAAIIPQRDTNVIEKENKRGEVIFSINENIASSLVQIASENRVTLSTVFQTIWGLLLQRYNDLDDVVFGSVVSGRPAEVEGIEDIIGLFVNTVPVRIKSNNEETLMELIKHVQRNSIEAEKYHFCSLAKIQSKTSVKQKLINNIFAFENYPVEKAIKDSEVDDRKKFKINNFEVFDQTNYDFNIAINHDKNINIRIFYNGAIYDEKFVNSIGGHIKTLVNTLINNSNIKLEDLEILTDVERNLILSDFNNTFRDYKINDTFKDIFEANVKENKNNIAIIDRHYSITFEELNKKANKLARVLRNKGLKANDIVGIICEQNWNMIVHILAVMKAGGAYLPIDSKYPDQRIEYVLEDSKAKFLLTNHDIKKDINFSGICIDECSCDFQDVSDNNLETINKFDDLAYVIYTSGTTGNPKGVMVQHKSLLNTCYWFIETFNLSRIDKSSKYMGVSFDPSIWEIFPQLIIGTQIHIINENMKLDMESLNNYFEENGITISVLPTQVCEQFMNIENKSLRTLITCGEKLKHYVKRSYKLVNGYGPTEDTVCATSFTVDRYYNNIPIGKPLANNQIYILDRNKKVQPIGVAGELYIAGNSLALGYINKKSLTEEKFVSNPFNEGSKMYRTGDRARFLPDGNIEFLGRKDDQIKLRGYRIELSEIERQILAYKDIKECVVNVEDYNSMNKTLCAYFISDTKINDMEIRDFLALTLPEYMIPKYFIQIDKMPLNRSDKIDKKALSCINKPVSKEEYVEPTNDVERKLIGIWCELLDSENISINDNFFEIGGDSILIIKMYSRIKNVFDKKIEVTDIFANPTIYKLAQFILKKDSNLSVQGIALNENYYNLSGAREKNIQLKFEIKDELLSGLKRISEIEKTDLDNILLSMYVYMFNQISESQSIVIQSTLHEKNEVDLYQIDLNRISEFKQLFKEVSKSKDNYYIEKINSVKFTKGYRTCTPFMYRKSLLITNLDLLNYFDIILGLDEEENCILATCLADSSFRNEEIKRMMVLFINSLKALTEQYQLN